jgi:hypothetical protein
MSTTITRREFDGVARRVSACRSAEKVARDEHAAARAAWERCGEPGERSREYRRWERAKEAHDAARQELAEAVGEQRGALGRLADGGGIARNGDGPRSRDGLWGDGWERLAAAINPSGGIFEASVDLGSLMKPNPLAAVGVTPSSGWTAPSYEIEGVVPMARDVRYLYPLLRSQQVEQGDLGIQEIKQTGERKVTGAVEREPMSTSDKAKLATGLTLEQVPLKQLAVYADEIPDKLFDAVQGLGDNAVAVPPLGPGSLLLEWLRDEMVYQLDRALDTHIIGQLIAAKPAFGEATGSLLTKIRTAVSAHRALGARPTILAVGPKVAIELDTLEDANKRPLFPLGVVGGASPLFGMTVLELQTDEHAPILIDPQVIGIDYYSLATLFVNPFVGGKKNLVDVRLEYDTLFHVRDVSGAYTLSKEALK